MNTLAPLFIVLALLIVTVVLLKIGKIRHAHIVSEGCVGLLYHKGKFVRVLAVEVKDAMFPANLKRAFSDVLKAKQEGQASLERARGESAALRNLANAARVLEGNPALMNLRLMQSLSSAQNAGSTLVLGLPGFMPLKNGKVGSAEHQPEDGAS